MEETDGNVLPLCIEGINGMTMIRENPSTLLIGTGGFGSPGRAYRSDDSGKTWRNISSNLPTDPIKDIKIVSSNEIWVGTANSINGRLFHTTNGGLTWKEINCGKPKETDITSIYVNPDNPNPVYVGTMNVHKTAYLCYLPCRPYIIEDIHNKKRRKYMESTI